MTELEGLEFTVLPPTEVIGATEELSIPEDYVPEVSSPTEKLPIVVNQARVDEVLSNLMDAYEKKEFPYNLDRVRLPQDPRHMPKTLPEGPSKDRAMFYWNVCYYMRGGTKSTRAVNLLADLYDDRPDLFDCEKILQTTPEDIAKELKAHGLGFQDMVSQHWMENAGRLLERYDGDPRKIFDGVTSYDVAVERIKNDGKGVGFMGFREKMTSMITYYLMDDHLIDTFNFPIPVDLHVMRVSIENKLVEFPGVPYRTDLYGPQLLAQLRDVYFKYAEDNNVDPLRLCDAVWLLSEAICGRAPGNQTSEPLGRKLRDGRKTYLQPEIVNIHDSAQQRRYEQTCRDCPVSHTCEYNVPGGATYYVAGAVIIRGLRQTFPPPPSPPPTLF